MSRIVPSSPQLPIFFYIKNVQYTCKWFDIGWLIGGLCCAFAVVIGLLVLTACKYMKATDRITELEERNEIREALLTPEERAEARDEGERRAQRTEALAAQNQVATSGWGNVGL